MSYNNDMMQKKDPFITVLWGIYFVYAFLLFYHPVETEDVWWHLATGKWILTCGQIPAFDPFPYGSEKTPWICLHWLGSSFLYFIYSIGDLFALKVFRSVFLVLVLIILYWKTKSRMPIGLLFILMIFIAFALDSRGLLRPDIFNHLFITIYLIIFFEYFHDLRSKRLVLIPFLGLLWFNIHMGAYIYGLGIICAFLFVAIIERSIQKVRALIWVLLFSLLAFLINPYGLDGLLYPVKVFLIPEFFDFYAKTSTTGESRSSIELLFSLETAYYIPLAITSIWAIWHSKNKQFALSILFLLGLFAFISMKRNCVFFALMSFCVIFYGLRDFDVFERLSKNKYYKIITKGILCAVLIFLCLSIFNIFRLAGIYEQKKISYLTIDANLYLEKAMLQLKRANVYGGVYTNDIIGNKVIWSGYPHLKPFYDGRQLDNQRFRDYVSLNLNTKESWERIQQKYGFNIAIITSADMVFDYLKTREDWQLIALSGYILIYVKKGVFNLPQEFDQYEEKLNKEVFSNNERDKLKALLSGPREARWYEKFVMQDFVMIDTYSEAIVLFKLSLKDAGLKRLLATLEFNKDYLTVQRVKEALKRMSILI